MSAASPSDIPDSHSRPVACGEEKAAVGCEADGLGRKAPATATRLEGGNELLRGGGDEVDGSAFRDKGQDVRGGRRGKVGKATFLTALEAW